MREMIINYYIEFKFTDWLKRPATVLRYKRTCVYISRYIHMGIFLLPNIGVGIGPKNCILVRLWLSDRIDQIMKMKRVISREL